MPETVFGKFVFWHCLGMGKSSLPRGLWKFAVIVVAGVISHVIGRAVWESGGAIVMELLNEIPKHLLIVAPLWISVFGVGALCIFARNLDREMAKSAAVALYRLAANLERKPGRNAGREFAEFRVVVRKYKWWLEDLELMRPGTAREIFHRAHILSKLGYLRAKLEVRRDRQA